MIRESLLALPKNLQSLGRPVKTAADIVRAIDTDGASKFAPGQLADDDKNVLFGRLGSGGFRVMRSALRHSI